MLEVKNEALHFSFPDVHPAAKFTLTLKRTLRVAEGQKNALPPGLGNFPVEHVDDHKGKVPAAWIEHGGVMVPMWQSEAMWLHFAGEYDPETGVRYPFAVKIAAGKINATTGEAWHDGLSNKQDYAVFPKQPWLDGFKSKDGSVRQFVAARLGEGRTVEGQVTGKEEVGGIQVVVYPMKRSEYDARFPKRTYRNELLGLERGGPFLMADSGSLESLSYGVSSAGDDDFLGGTTTFSATASVGGSTALRSRGIGATPRRKSLQAKGAPVKLDMGLGAGGEIVQEIFSDEYGIECWETEGQRCFIHLCNSEGWKHVTGRYPKTKPFDANDYRARNYPWFAWYDEGEIVPGSDTLDAVPGVSTPTQVVSSHKPQPFAQQNVTALGPKAVRVGNF